MNGMSIHDLRLAGARVRHDHGINTCVRCNAHFLPTGSEAPGAGAHGAASPRANGLPCFAHSSPASDGVYPCCNGGVGTRGCCPTQHLPLFDTDAQGKVDGNNKLRYEQDILLLSPPSSGAKVASGASVAAPAGAAAKPVSESASSSAPGGGDASRAVDPALLVPTPLRAEEVSPSSETLASVGAPVPRTGDEIMVCGQLYHTGTPIVLWGDVKGYDHYRVERRFCPYEESSWADTQKSVPSFSTPNRYGLRKDGLTDEEVERVRGGQWDLPTLQKQMKHFVLHYDQCGLARECFRILQDHRDLSVHFMLDLDGTIYQALDLKERAWHATTSNTCGVGVEIANVGAYDPHGPNPFTKWYSRNEHGTVITIPKEFGDGGILTPDFVGQPARQDPVEGVIQGQTLVQYDYTPQQYAALTKLIATFCTIFPAIPSVYPTDSDGKLITKAMPPEALNNFRGILGHYHLQANKIDPGPAMQWDLVTGRARQIMERSKQEKAKRSKKLAASVAPGGSPSASSSALAAEPISQESAHLRQLALLRKSERRLLQLAEDAAAKRTASNSPEAKSDPFYLVPLAWHRALQSWLTCADASTARPGPIPTRELLASDGRSARAGLQLGADYLALHPLLWSELLDLYGADGAPVLRPTPDIYGGAKAKARSGAASSASPATNSPPSYATEETEGWDVL